ncbi:acyltransferase domain-containing protein [Kitasatospora sp. NPDC048365]|uniref:acyltransferase domain-containing protein n=1 Tax=Kitasatospora sp. NPDC048365 TaxID=3364050 RepID=UPI0037144DD4
MTATPARPRPVALLLPGQGAQHARMAHGLYRTVPAFTDALDEVLDLLGPDGAAVRTDWLAEQPAVPLDDVRRAQPLLFAIDYALARTLHAWGVRPAAILGHSVGEAVGAVLAGVLPLADAVRLLAERIEAIADAPPGGMLAVAATAEAVIPYLTEQVVIGAINGPQQLLLAGPDPDLAVAEAELIASGITCMRARATSGFHSPSLRPACRRTLAGYDGVELRAPRTPLVSGYTAGELSAGSAVDPGFWAMQPAEPVLFGPALDALLARGPHLLVEAGPGQGLSALARRHPEVGGGRSAVVPLLGSRPRTPADDLQNLLRAARAIEAEGHPVSPYHLAPA